MPTRSKASHIAWTAVRWSRVSGRTEGPPWQASAIDIRLWQSCGLFQKQSGTRSLTKWRCHERCCSSGWRSSVTRLQRQPAARSFERRRSRSGRVYLRNCSYPPPPMWISTASRSPLSPPGVRSASSTRCVTIWNCTLLYRLTNDTKSNRPSCACRCSTERSVVPAVFSRWWKKSTEQLGRGCCTSATGVAVAGAGGGKADGGGESCAFGGGRDCGRRERGGVPCGAVLTGASTATSSSLPRCVPAGLSPAGTVREMDEGRSECCGAERRARKARRPASVQMPLQGQRGWLSRSLITRSRGCIGLRCRCARYQA
mmetsp:Transcript_30639/g.98009  ORF Transcript_30639/g.98009 Transcript_30639/m.98009 type:complete len:314 (-) Transcript_30639:3-944(-)